MKRVLLMLIILFVSVSAVSAADNMTDDVLLAESDDVNVGDNYPDVNVDENLQESDGNVILGNSSVEDISIEAKDLVWYYKANPVYEFRIVDSNGTGVAAENVSVFLRVLSINL